METFALISVYCLHATVFSGMLIKCISAINAVTSRDTGSTNSNAFGLESEVQILFITMSTIPAVCGLCVCARVFVLVV